MAEATMQELAQAEIEQVTGGLIYDGSPDHYFWDLVNPIPTLPGARDPRLV